VGSTSRYGRATINPTGPSALGICDGCGILYNLRELRWQFEWCGTTMQNLHLRVCSQCWDVPQQQLRTIILPPDPPSVRDPRTEPFAIDERNELTLSKIIGKPSMFFDEGTFYCELESGLGLEPAFAGLGDLLAAVSLGIGLVPSFADTGAATAALLLGIGLTAPFADTGALTAEVDVVVPAVDVSREATGSFGFSTHATFTETGAAIGSAAAGRLVFVALSGFNETSNDGIDSMTIGGVSAALASSVSRANAFAFIFSEVWYALVPTGTTADIVMTFTGDTVTANGAIYKVLNADAVTPIASQNTGSVVSGNVSAAVTIGNGTVTIATSQAGINSTDIDVTWTNATEDFDLAIDLGGVFGNEGFASRADVSGPGATTITASPASADVDTNKTLAIVVIQP
jgi:hypothetical protein